MSKVLILKGLPASGKSTYAKELVAQGGWKRVNKDDLRALLDNSKWSRANEKFVLKTRDFIIIQSLADGFNVIVDDTNLDPKHEETIRNLIKEQHYMKNIQIEVRYFDTSFEECIKRDTSRPSPVGKDVIMQMYNRYLKPEPIIYIPPKDKPKAIIVDIDGTLSHMTTRKGRPYDWHRVGEDAVDEIVADIVRNYYRMGHEDIMEENEGLKVIILSGRDGVCRPETEKWLKDNQIPYDYLFMRTANDNRKDNIVKQEIFEKEIRDNYQVLFVMDDRNQVVDMWRNELGLKVLQVEEGNF